MEKYFENRSKKFYEGEKTIDTSDSKLLKGLRHANTEKVPSFKQKRSLLKEPNLPLTPNKPSADPLWRFHWLLNRSGNVKP